MKLLESIAGATIELALAALLLVLLPCTPLFAQDPKPPNIRFPVVLQPAPVGAVPQLTAGVVYVVDADVPYLLWASPQGLVTITEGQGPVKVFARFLDGSGKTEWKEFKGKQVFIIEAAGTGTVEFIFSAVGATKSSDAIRKTVDVDAGQGPIPPPKPPDPPGPVDAFTAAVQAAYALDGKPAAVAAQLAAVYRQSGSVINNPASKVPKDILDAMHGAIQSLIGDALPKTRLAIAAEIDRTVGLSNAALDTAKRALISQQFGRVQAALEGLK